MPTQQKSPGPNALNLERTELVKAELELILQSQAFRRSDRHSRFLRFVCEETLSGESAHLNEYLVAHRVFERGEDYSPSEDSVVRRQAYSLRQKLQEYYSGEGKNDAVRIELPLGRYVPTFQFVDQPARLNPVLPVPESPERFPNPVEGAVNVDSIFWRRAVLLVAIAALIATAGWFVGTRTRRAPTLDPVFSRIWGPWLSFSDGSVICFSNALTAGIRRTDEPFPKNNLTRGIPLREEEAEPIRKQFGLPTGGYFYMNPAPGTRKNGRGAWEHPAHRNVHKSGRASEGDAEPLP